MGGKTHYIHGGLYLLICSVNYSTRNGRGPFTAPSELESDAIYSHEQVNPQIEKYLGGEFRIAGTVRSVALKLQQPVLVFVQFAYVYA